MSTAEKRRYHLPSQLPDRWTSAYGEDRFGIWSEVEIFGVTQRFRWIQPGEFLMGSPEDEPEREGNELQHQVVLTKGFWLADTACTQALWQAVTGSNPSRFKGDDKQPVEQVSWEHCQAFFEKVNKAMPRLSLRFPTEAEWECSCRAGMPTPFWFGGNITTDQVNYDGDSPYSGGDKGIYRGETVTVKSLPPNGWGLYEMHGNVWEWCQDWYGEYSTDRVVDPRGPEQGDDRVLRGGSWFFNGRWCRSASRHANHPGLRYGAFGFRLARGQAEQE